VGWRGYLLVRHGKGKRKSRKKKSDGHARSWEVQGEDHQIGQDDEQTCFLF